MRGALALFRMRLTAGMQYRAAAWAGVATQFFWGMLSILIYKAFYASSAQKPMEFSALCSYIWLQQAFLMLMVLYRQDNALLTAIERGDTAYELARPVSLYPLWCARVFALRLSSAVLRFPPVLLLAFFLPDPYRLSLPPGLLSFFLFLAALFLGLCVNVGLSMLIYLITMRTLSSVGARILVTTAADFGSGLLLPLPLMPDGLRDFLSLLPFRCMADLPFRIWTGDIPPAEALPQLALALFWAVFLLFIGWISMKRALARVVVQGG